MTTTQLNVRVPVALAEQLRQAAHQQGRGVGTIVAQALTAHLAGASSQAPGGLAVASSALATQLAAIEQRLQALELAPPASPERVRAAPPELAPPIAPMGEALPLPERRLTPAEAEGLVPLPQVADDLGLSGGGSAITNWIAREARNRDGGVPLGAVYRGWRLRGKGLLPGGQKAGWLFDRLA